MSLLERCPQFRGCYVQASMELGPEDVSLLERCVLFSQGKLLFCHAPPGVNISTFNASISGEGEREGGREKADTLSTVNDEAAVCKLTEFDKQFLQQVCC